jgi:hypothetical protein
MNFSEQLKNPRTAGIIGVLVGLIIGLIMGWGVWPVQWENAAAVDLRPDLQADYLRAAIDSYGKNPNDMEAQRRWAELGEAAPAALAAIEANPGAQSDTLPVFRAVVSANIPPATDDGQAGDGKAGTSPLLLAACLVLLIVAAALLATLFLRRTDEPGELTPAQQAIQTNIDTEQTDYEAMGEDPPLSQYMTTFVLGDDLFDDSFSIDSPAGEFLGECGVGIAETIGVGEPKRVTSFEVWLFDKNDIQTVTKVLMSEHAFYDTATRDRLAAKGEPTLAEIEHPVVLETETLRLVARLVDMGYGSDALPDNSFFDRMTIELAVWQKA